MSVSRRTGRGAVVAKLGALVMPGSGGLGGDPVGEIGRGELGSGRPAAGVAARIQASSSVSNHIGSSRVSRATAG